MRLNQIEKKKKKRLYMRLFKSMIPNLKHKLYFIKEYILKQNK